MLLKCNEDQVSESNSLSIADCAYTIIVVLYSIYKVHFSELRLLQCSITIRYISENMDKLLED